MITGHRLIKTKTLKKGVAESLCAPRRTSFLSFPFSSSLSERAQLGWHVQRPPGHRHWSRQSIPDTCTLLSSFELLHPVLQLKEVPRPRLRYKYLFIRHWLLVGFVKLFDSFGIISKIFLQANKYIWQPRAEVKQLAYPLEPVRK
jgi:hypothetical protein